MDSAIVGPGSAYSFSSFRNGERVEDSSLCTLDECDQPRYVDENGKIHDCCGFRHAMEQLRRRVIETKKENAIKGITHCLLPRCNRVTWPFKNYCGRTHAQEGMRMGLRPPSLRGSERTDLCELPGCFRQKRHKADGSLHNFCGINHAREAGKMKKDTPPASLKTQEEVREFLKAFKKLKIVSITENIHAKPGGDLYKKFAVAQNSLPEVSRKTILAFHGTSEENIDNICVNGYDESKRSRQFYGEGEYFATTPTIPLQFVRGGKRLLLNELLMGQENVHHTKHGDIVVMKHSTHDLPRFIITFE